MPSIDGFVQPVEGVRGKQRISNNPKELSITLEAIRLDKLKPSTYMTKVLMRDGWIKVSTAPRPAVKEGEPKPRGGARNMMELTAKGVKMAEQAKTLNAHGLKILLAEGKRTLNHRAQAGILDDPKPKVEKATKAAKPAKEKAAAKPKAEAKKAIAKTTTAAREAIKKARTPKAAAPAKEAANA